MTLKILFFSAILIFTQNTFAQNNLSNYELTLNGNFNKSIEDISIGSYKTDLQSNNTRLEIGINRFVSNRIMLGIGLDYFNNKEQFDYTYYNVDNEFVVEDHPELKTEIFIPSINLKYVKFLSEKLLIGLNVCNGIGFSTSKMNSVTELKVNRKFSDFELVNSDLQNSQRSFEKENEESFYSLTLKPEICYYFTTSIGLNLRGDFYRFDTINKNQFFFNTKTNQVSWTLGFSWRI